MLLEIGNLVLLLDQKDSHLKSMETRRIQKLKDQKSMETRRRL